MKLAIIGAGNVGSALTHAFVRTGHDVTLSATSTTRLGPLGREADVATTTSNAEAATGADVVVLAVPSAAVDDVVGEIGRELDGTVVIDTTNQVKPDLSGLGGDRSVTERIQALVPGARVVKALNTVFASTMAEPVVDRVPLDAFLAGDDAEAKARVSELVAGIGFRPIDVGGVAEARHLEVLAYLNIVLNARNGWPWESGWKLVGVPG